MGCFCDDLCTFFDDCCVDADKSFQKKINRSLHDYINCTYDCKVSARKFYAVVDCPRDYGSQYIADLCSVTNTTDLFLQIPAMGRESGLMYKNVFCAQCHAEESDLWQPRVKCVDHKPIEMNETFTMTDILANGNCFLQLLPPPNASDFRPCFEDIISTCPDVEMEEQCSHTSGYKILWDSIHFRYFLTSILAVA
ncbi:uncharacterized protein [Haliotis cracherodii]|uniref:uncharacterized protein n=1 Tax=Haliotis cracherodii TaxID=6455 RepID=UPI0039E896C5